MPAGIGRRVAPFPVLAALLLGACAGESAHAGFTPAVPRIDTLPGGVIQVTNAGPTSWPDTGGWRFVEERVIAPDDGTPGEIGSPDGVAIGTDGAVYVIQRKPHAIKVYGPDGTFRRDIGRDGEGPGEFRVGYIGVRGDTIALQDPALFRFTTFLADGTLLQNRPSPGNWATSYLDIDREGHAAVPGAIGTDGGGYRPAMLRIRFDGTASDTVWLRDSPAPAKRWRASWIADGRTWNMRIPAPLQPALHQRYDAGGRLVYGTTDQPSLIVSRTGLDTLRIIHTTTPAMPVQAAQGDSIFEAALAGMEWRAEWLIEGGRDDVPAVWPAWSALSVDGNGFVWLGLPGSTGAVETAQVFDSTGVLLGTVPIPHPRLLHGAWGGDRVAVLDESDADLPIVRVFRLERTRR